MESMNSSIIGYRKGIQYNVDTPEALDSRYSVDLNDMPKEIVHIIQEVNKSFYFSPKGILIKKSKIPYIF